MIEERKEAIREVALAIRSPLMMILAPERERIMALAVEHNITVAELLEFFSIKKARKT
jgi:hypothetical protein